MWRMGCGNIICSFVWIWAISSIPWPYMWSFNLPSFCSGLHQGISLLHFSHQKFKYIRFEENLLIYIATWFVCISNLLFKLAILVAHVAIQYYHYSISFCCSHISLSILYLPVFRSTMQYRLRDYKSNKKSLLVILDLLGLMWCQPRCSRWMKAIRISTTQSHIG